MAPRLRRLVLAPVLASVCTSRGTAEDTEGNNSLFATQGVVVP